MQYLLTEAEYQALVPADELRKARDALHEARVLILKTAKFECIHTLRKGSARRVGGYCDCCPIGDLDKGPDYDAGTKICTLSRNYSK